jgi:galactitol-specific phosphotransferase system IIB component
MASVVGAIGTLVSGGLGKLIKDVVGTFKLSPEKKAEIEQIVDQHEFELKMKEYELEKIQSEFMAKEIQVASDNIKAEMATGDKFTARARPTFMYVVYTVIIWNFILLPILQMIRGMAVLPIELPSDMYWLFGCGYLGYAGFRSLDKSGFKWNKGGK